MGVETGTVISGIAPVASQKTAGPVTMPRSSAARQVKSWVEAGAKRPARIPVAPMTRPSTSIRSTADSPIRTPPPRLAQGVKAVSYIVSYLPAVGPPVFI
jgi:hypothetical protein